MTKLFEISIPAGMTELKLDSQGRASAHYTVQHVGARPVDAIGVLTPVPTTPSDPNHPVKKGWVKIDGKPERHFEVNGQDTFTVNIAPPPKVSFAPGTYGFRLDVVSVARPDEGDSSPVLKFEVKPAPVKPKPKLGLILAIIAAVVVIGAVGAYFGLRHNTKGVPDVKGMAIMDATTALTAKNIRIEQPIATQVDQPDNAGKVVSQSLVPGTAITKDSSIKLTVGAQMVPVPRLIGMTVAEAQKTLTAKNLNFGQANSAPNPNFGPGLIWQQSLDETKSAPTNSVINVTTTPMTVSVPVLTGVDLNTALQRITDAQLGFGGFSGNLTTAPTIGQSVPASTPVPVGTPVSLVFPATFACQPPARCYYTGQTARMMVLKPNVLHF